jgi:penicillin-binding protein 2
MRNLRLFSRILVATALFPAAAFLGTTPLPASPVSATQSAAAPSGTAAKKKHRSRRHASRRTTAGRKTASSTSAHTETQAALIHTDDANMRRVSRTRRHSRHRVFYNPWTEPTYADSTVGDNIDGEDLVVRKAAVDALGPYNGTVVVSDPQTGRILTMVNQKLALKGAFQPCSTVKIVVSLASLNEGVVEPTTPVRLTRRYSMDLTQALARSNNFFFARLGQKLGFERVEKYAKLFGLGEKAGFNIPGEEPGFLTSEPPSSGVGMMTSFGDGIRLTPLELASLVGAIANGGTMYYLQYPKDQTEVKAFAPRVKRSLDIANLIPEIKPGMMAAVEYGTAKRANFNPDEPVLGKTGTCTDTAQPGVHLGWFGSFNDVGKHKLVVVVLLTGGRGISGPIASGVAGNVYRNLSQQNYFQADEPVGPSSLVSMQNCCSANVVRQ